MQVNRYDYIMSRVEYPLERGYRMEPSNLPDWIYVTITRDNNAAIVRVHSRIHKNKDVSIGPSYSLDFKNEEILTDVSGEIAHRFLS